MAQQERRVGRQDFWRNRLRGAIIIHHQFNRDSSRIIPHKGQGQLIRLDQWRKTIVPNPTTLSPNVVPFPGETALPKKSDWGDDMARLEEERVKREVKHKAKRAGRVKTIFFGALAAVSAIDLAYMGAAAVRDKINPVQQSLSEYQQDKNDANVSGSELLAKYREPLSRIKIGGSFAPEEFGVSLQNLDTKYGKNQTKKALDALKFAHEKLHMDDIRFGIRWDNVVDKNGNIDFRLYKPYLDYMIKNKMNIVITAGIKTPRWKEDFVPSEVLNSLKSIPADGSVIQLQSELGQKSLAFTKKLFKYMQTTYLPEELAQVKVVQLENEPFQSFGEHGWTMSKEYLTASMLQAKEVFPNADMQITSAGFLNINQATAFLEELVEKHPEFKNKVRLGVDNYLFYNGTIDLPGGIKFNPLKLPIGDVDQVVYAENLGNMFKKLIEDSRRIGFMIVISEGQIEPWGDYNKVTAVDFNRLVLRSVRRILDPDANSIIYLWGLENLIQTNDGESKKIFDVITVLNTQKPKEVTMTMGTDYYPNGH